MTTYERLVSERFPLSSKYHPEWVIANASGGANALWLTEWLTEALDLRSGMRVLDLGCGLAMSSVFLRRWWEPSMCCLHSAEWWRRHWERTGILDIDLADTLPDSWRFWRDWQRVAAPDNAAEIQALEADRGSYLGYVRLVGRRRPGACLDEPIVSIPSEYAKKTLLRSSG